VLGAKLDRRASALVGLGRGRANVHDGDVGLEPPNRSLQLLGVPGLGGDCEPTFRQHTSEPLAEKHRVLGDHDTDGISPRIRVPAPGTLWTRRRPPFAGFVEGLGLDPRPAQALALTLLVPLSFVLSKRFAFRLSPDPRRGNPLTCHLAKIVISLTRNRMYSEVE
jgi:hypothetical protein